MPELNKKQRELLKLTSKGGNDASLFLLDKIYELEDAISEAKEDIKDLKIIFDSTPAEKRFSDEANIEKMTIKLATKLAKLEKGDKGDSPIAGIDYHIPQDGYTPIKGVDYFDGLDGKDADEEKIIKEVLNKVPKPKDGSPDTPEEITNKLNILEEEIEQKVIKGLKKALADLETRISSIKVGRGIFGASRVYKRLTGQRFTETADGVRSKFTLPKATILNDTIAIFQNGTRRSEGSARDYTITGRTVTFTTAPQSNDELLVDFEYY